VKYYQKFCTQREAFRSEDVDLETPLQDLFGLLDWEPEDMWEDAKMLSLFKYLRGSKSLNLGDWRPWFPTTLPL
jgi:hypothetical protein